MSANKERGQIPPFHMLCKGEGLMNQQKNQKVDVRKLAQAAIFAALAYIGFQVFRIDIPIAGGKTAFHLGNTFVVLAALMLGGVWGGLAGGVGLTIADLTAGYATSAPKTFLMKFLIGLIVGIVAHKVCHISKETDKKKLTVSTFAASAAGMIFNTIFDPIIGYFYKVYLLGIEQNAAQIIQKIAAGTTAFNALLTVIVAGVLYLVLRPVLKKSGLFFEV